MSAAALVVIGDRFAGNESCFVNGVDKCISNEEALIMAAKKHPDSYECDDVID